jgi:phosphoribosylformylglycinamidine cyclo-ligase
MTEQGLTYAGAGVSFGAKEETTDRLKRILSSTYRPEVLSEVGHFGGLFALGNYDEPVLVSSTDGVGTKLKIAFMTGRHDTVGYDIVAHCANDILVQGAEPLFFLDYIGTSKLYPDVVEQIVTGLAAGCREIGCAFIGGETAELPEFYREGEYDLVGTIVGVVERSKVITGDEMRPGDQLIGLSSLGLHTNGFSLARRILLDVCGYNPADHISELGMTLGEELLKHHKSYVGSILNLRKHSDIKGMAHITGGGLPGNLARVLPSNCSAIIRKGTWENPPIFGLLQEKGRVESDEMYRVFNMGIGMVLAVARDQVDTVLNVLTASGESPFHIGEIVDGEGQVTLSETP